MCAVQGELQDLLLLLTTFAGALLLLLTETQVIYLSAQVGPLTQQDSGAQ